MSIKENTVKTYRRLLSSPQQAYVGWRNSCASSENSVHQLSPYIGKLKSTIAKDLILKYSKQGDLLIDPFSGSGTIPFEAALQGRNVFASDISPYACILSKGKLSVPKSEEEALGIAKNLLQEALDQPEPDLRTVPAWVRKFFHPNTLKEAIQFSNIANKKGYEFFFGCFLGILHHQRPGFLSYPSSHLVPYLRNKKFPISSYPEMYEYRDLYSRFLAKIKRAYKRYAVLPNKIQWEFQTSDIQKLIFPKRFDCLITSPPYMNTLDYGRDNRLRLWFISPNMNDSEVDNPVTKAKDAFEIAMKCLANKTNQHLKINGYCVLIVGERLGGSKGFPLSKAICEIFEEHAKTIKLHEIIRDKIPDIRRSRRDCRGTKSEHILVFKKNA